MLVIAYFWFSFNCANFQQDWTILIHIRHFIRVSPFDVLWFCNFQKIQKKKNNEKSLYLGKLIFYWKLTINTFFNIWEELLVFFKASGQKTWCFVRILTPVQPTWPIERTFTLIAMILDIFCFNWMKACMFIHSRWKI